MLHGWCGKEMFVCLFSFLEMKYRIVDNAVVIRGNDKISILKINCKIKRLICNYHIYILLIINKVSSVESLL